MPKTATALKDVSQLIKAGDKLLLVGSNYILQGHTVPQEVPTERLLPDGSTENYLTPNFYSAKVVQAMGGWFEITSK